MDKIQDNCVFVSVMYFDSNLWGIGNLNMTGKTYQQYSFRNTEVV